MLTVTWCFQSVVSRHDSTSKLVVVPLYYFVQLFASKASNRWKYDMGALSWLNAETLKRVPTCLFGRLVR